jgi:hypothetical protein
MSSYKKQRRAHSSQVVMNTPNFLTVHPYLIIFIHPFFNIKNITKKRAGMRRRKGTTQGPGKTSMLIWFISELYVRGSEIDVLLFLHKNAPLNKMNENMID